MSTCQLQSARIVEIYTHERDDYKMHNLKYGFPSASNIHVSEVWLIITILIGVRKRSSMSANVGRFPSWSKRTFGGRKDPQMLDEKSMSKRSVSVSFMSKRSVFLFHHKMIVCSGIWEVTRLMDRMMETNYWNPRNYKWAKNSDPNSSSLKSDESHIPTRIRKPRSYQQCKPFSLVNNVSIYNIVIPALQTLLFSLLSTSIFSSGRSTTIPKCPVLL